ncbi:MAG: efflux RND transporter periplasmic adaptor subunit [Verrucomicrobiae bacterium]|nr:efflux RND transporter periplasmic adaptor subunit [Verrucomicrobiae bacterium]
MKPLALLIALAIAGCERAGHKYAPTKNLPPVRVKTVLLQLQKVPDIYEVVGTVRPKLGATVSPKIMATIQEVRVKPGDTVKAGDVLAQLDDREMRAAFERAQADYDRYKKLLEQGVGTAVEFQAAEERFRVAKAALSYATITAPFDGIVAEKFCEPGDLAVPGKPLFTVEQPTDYRLEAYVPERYNAAVAVGSKVRVAVEAVGGECDATVGEVVPASDPASRSFLVKLDLHRRKPLRSGMFGRAKLVVGEREGLFVPKTAVRERGQLAFVFVAQDGRARLRLVKTGKTLGENVEVLSGVEPGETIIVSADAELSDGRQIQPQ